MARSGRIEGEVSVDEYRRLWADAIAASRDTLDRQRQQKELVQPARPEHIAEDIARQRSRRGDIEFMDPGDDTHRPKTINLLQASAKLHRTSARRAS